MMSPMIFSVEVRRRVETRAGIIGCVVEREAGGSPLRKFVRHQAALPIMGLSFCEFAKIRAIGSMTFKVSTMSLNSLFSPEMLP